MELIEGQGDDDGVEGEFVEGPDAFFEQYFGFERRDCSFVGASENSVINPVFQVVAKLAK